ncbi:Uncharacterised protein [Mycobacterium tuberculosis]|nr:hypothetical protein FF22_03084 [Mycobacterium tuberculosis]CKS90161.1 Uncharacterised protein [Mycobacterium tuberculosis]CKY81425.1 Uncharacterised protein [Mycobacterium tuberculosis]CMS35532.1 Uncharacterised protein [Mycobacterium tuberculosis]CNN49407.1 Uncharacterised protein [Mycobacterium tuberculosis]
MVTNSAATISPQPMLNNGSCHSNCAPAASATDAPTTAAAVKKATTRSRSALGIISAISDHAATPAAPSNTCAGPNFPGTANARAAPMGTSAAIDSAIPERGERMVINNPASALATAIPATASSPASTPVATR